MAEKVTFSWEIPLMIFFAAMIMLTVDITYENPMGGIIISLLIASISLIVAAHIFKNREF